MDIENLERAGVVDDRRTASARNMTNVIYALQAASFIVGVTFLVAVIINYVKRSEAQGTWLESHFRWQIRTFWFGLLWGIIGAVTSLILIGYAILVVNAVWLIYRIGRGWLRVADGEQMYVA